MPKCFCAFVVVKYECVFKVSELYRMPRHFRQKEKKIPAQTTTRPRPGTTPDRILRNRNFHQTNKK